MMRFAVLAGLTVVMSAVMWIQPMLSSQAPRPAPPPRPPAELLRLSLAAEKEGLALPFKGITAKGEIEPNLFVTFRMLIELPVWSFAGEARLAVVLWLSWVAPLTVTEVVLRSVPSELSTRAYLRFP